MSDDKYNGWHNWETWNVGLWLSNEEHLYMISKNFKDYKKLRECLKNLGEVKTGDGVSYYSKKLNINELNEMLSDF